MASHEPGSIWQLGSKLTGFRYLASQDEDPANAELRPREYLTKAEVEKLIRAAKDG
jgi:hypothetical protein